jgi:hypothetical protein
MKFKLYRLSIALAFLTCSFKDSSLSTVVVSKDHVDYISGFLDKIYTKAGLHEGAEKDRSGSEIEKPEMDEIVAKIYDRVGGVVDKSKIIKVIKWMGFQQPSFSKDQIHQVFELNRDKEVSPLVSILQSEGLIWNNRRGFVITGKGVKAVRLLKEEKEEGGGE